MKRSVSRKFEAFFTLGLRNFQVPVVLLKVFKNLILRSRIIERISQCSIPGGSRNCLLISRRITPTHNEKWLTQNKQVTSGVRVTENLDPLKHYNSLLLLCLICFALKAQTTFINWRLSSEDSRDDICMCFGRNQICPNSV